jgi:hypothetical protein
MLRVVFALLRSFLAPAVSAQGADSIFGSWHLKITRGQYFYTDENSFDPDKHEEYNTREWGPTPIRQR